MALGSGLLDAHQWGRRTASALEGMGALGAALGIGHGQA